MTAALSGKTATVQSGSGGTPADLWTDIQEVYEIGELPIERDTYDATSHDSSFYREYIMGLFVTSSLTMSANYVKAQYDALFALVGGGTLGWYRIADPQDNSTHVFQAFVANVSPSSPLDDRLTYSITLTVSGAVTRDVIT